MPVVEKIRCSHGFRAKCVCDQCRGPFERQLSAVKGKKHVFCSWGCYNAFRAKPEGWIGPYGYVYTWTNGRIRAVHRLVMEKALGRKLLSSEIVHHIRGNKLDNRLKSLKLQTRSDHPPGYTDINLETINRLLQEAAVLKQENAALKSRAAELEGEGRRLNAAN